MLRICLTGAFLLAAIASACKQPPPEMITSVVTVDSRRFGCVVAWTAREDWPLGLVAEHCHVDIDTAGAILLAATSKPTDGHAYDEGDVFLLLGRPATQDAIEWSATKR